MINLTKCKDQCMECEYRHKIEAPNLINPEILEDIEEDCSFCGSTKRMIIETEARLSRIKELISKDKRVCLILNDRKVYGRIEKISADYSSYRINETIQHRDIPTYISPYSDYPFKEMIYRIPQVNFIGVVTIILDKGLEEYNALVFDLEFTDNRFTKFELEYLSNLIVNDNGSRTLLKKIDSMIEEM